MRWGTRVDVVPCVRGVVEGGSGVMVVAASSRRQRRDPNAETVRVDVLLDPPDDGQKAPVAGV